MTKKDQEMLELLSKISSALDKQADDEATEEFNDIVNNPYEGTKRLYVSFGSMWWGDKPDKEELSKLNYVCDGYYDIGDSRGGGTVYTGEFTHEEVVAMYKKYEIDNKNKDKDTFLFAVFELNGWHYDPEKYWAQEEIISESGSML